MSTTCPNGHLSEAADYCDQCGARLTDSNPPSVDGPEARTGPSTASQDHAEVPPITTPSVPAEPCPDCGAPRVGGDKFCEGCGYNFATRESSDDPAPTSSPAPTTGRWEALVNADPEYFERVATEEIDFPAHCPARTFALNEPEIAIGRHNPSRGVRPQIDLSGAPEDTAISHVHAILIRQDDSSYSLVDPGSSNGTTVNDDPAPIALNSPVPLADGDRIHLGAWTTITVQTAGAGKGGR
jgi:hypothetical protein